MKQGNGLHWWPKNKEISWVEENQLQKVLEPPKLINSRGQFKFLN